MNIPEQVADTFNALYPSIGAGNAGWSWSLPGKLYQASFVDEDELVQVEITVTGHHLCTQKTADPDTIPQAVLDTISSEFSEFDLEGIEEVVFSDGSVLYEAGFLGGEPEEEDEEEPEEDDEEEEEDTLMEENEEDMEAAYGEYFQVYINADGHVLVEEEEETA